MALNGKWYLTSTDGLDPFIDACGADREKLAPLIAGLQMTGPNGYVEEISIDGGNIHRKVFIGGQLKRDKTAPIGPEHDGERWDGSPVKATITVDGNTLKRHEKMGATEIDTVAVAAGDNITMTLSCGGVSCVRKYQKC